MHCRFPLSPTWAISLSVIVWLASSKLTEVLLHSDNGGVLFSTLSYPLLRPVRLLLLFLRFISPSACSFVHASLTTSVLILFPKYRSISNKHFSHKSSSDRSKICFLIDVVVAWFYSDQCLYISYTFSNDSSLP